MRKIQLFSLLAAVVCAANGWANVNPDDHKLLGAFSVSATKKVYFSSGNLQYQASTDTWRFAEHQYDMIGNAPGNTTTVSNGRDTQSAWIDLFGYGTGNNPTLVSMHDADYETFTDWAIAAEDNVGSGWRTPTYNEYSYILYDRNNYSSLKGKGSVNGVNGLILLPDEWILPDGASFTAELTDYTTNTYTLEQWAVMEAAGAVFMPAVGQRSGTTVNDGGQYGGYYWLYSDISYKYCHATMGGLGARNRDAYKGNAVRLISETAPMVLTPLTFEAKEAGATVTYTLNSTKPIQYSTDGTTWTDYSDAITLANVGDKVSFRGNNTTYYTINAKFTCTADCYIYGNIMSLVSSTGYATAISLSEKAFYGMFSGNTHIKNHPSNELVLPATTLAKYCYTEMFKGCTGLTSSPSLPAATLADYCYEGMFRDCTGLTGAPELLSTVMKLKCYRYMFYGCTSLTSAPELPATTLADYSYEGMFQYCSGLTMAPELPATTLADYCYNNMFWGCSSLTIAPELPAATLANNCYGYMFYGCTNLSSLTCYATETATYATVYWLYNVSATGTFYAPSDGYFNNQERGVSAIPEGWNISLPLASITAAPTAVDDLVYTGSAQELIHAGTADGGTMMYSLNNSTWSDAIPTGTDVGSYTVYYKVVGDANHSDIAGSSLEVTISKPTVNISGNEDPQHPGTYYSTFYYSLFKYRIPEGVEAYAATIGESDLYLKKIAEVDDVLQEGTAVILKSDVQNYTMVPTDEDAMDITEANDLRGVDEPTTAPANCYVLSGHSTDNSVQGVGFYQYSGTLKAHRAFVVLGGGASSAPKKLRFVYDTETGMENVQGDKVQSTKVLHNGQLYIMYNGTMYNVQGQMVK